MKAKAVRKQTKESTADGSTAANKRTRRLFISAIAVLFLDLILAASVFGFLFLRPSAGFGHRARSVVVPDAVGLCESAARELFSVREKSGEIYAVSVRYEYADAPYGQVLSQEPSAGNRRKAVPGIRPCRVTLCVSLGQKTVTVPDPIGKDARDAQLLLSSLGLSVEFRVSPAALRRHDGVRFANGIPSGTVRDLIPPVGTAVTVGSTVTLVLAPPPVGEKSAIVPDLSGLSREEACRHLLAVGFTVGEVTVLREGGSSPFFAPSESVAVAKQQYVAGTRMRCGTPIGFTLVARPSPFAEG